MITIRAIALTYLIILIAFFLGFYICDTQIWPYATMKNIQNFVAGHPEENTSLVGKIKNDFDFRPSRHIIEYEKKNDFVSSNYKQLKGLPLNSRRKNPKMFLSHKAPLGYRVICGTFDFRKGLHGAILIDPSGRIANVWQISQDGVDWKHYQDSNVFLHGFEISPDGSIVTAYENGTSLIKYDYCGNIIWRIKGSFHHSIAFEDSGAIWSWGNVGSDVPYGYNLSKIDYDTGEVLKEIPLIEVLNANPDIDIFGIRQIDTVEGSKWINDVWHANDIEPLPKRFEQYYPGFNAGDLLVSLRSPNLIFVMDPDTIKVKWWRQGLTRRQHDPDWNNQGKITVFNNNMHRGYSNIMELDPVTYEYKIIVEGTEYEFYTWHRGKHQLVPNGGVLITSSAQGRVFEVDGEGKITFEFLNTYGGKNEYLSLSEARFLPKDFFKELPQCN